MIDACRAGSTRSPARRRSRRRAAGGRSRLCAGHDLKELTAHRNDPDRGRAFFDKTMRACSALMQKIVALPQPVVAAVDEMATAAGCQLVASCDLAVAGLRARFCTPGVNIGLFCSTPAVALSRNVPPKHAMEMLLTGVPISAEEALRIGLVNRMSADGARIGALALARTIAEKSPQAIRFGKRAFYAQSEKPLSEAYELASAVMVENMLVEDARGRGRVSGNAHDGPNYHSAKPRQNDT
jgi:enoyl-CoA hydratase/carnithine racemase